MTKEVTRAFLWEIENQSQLCGVAFRGIVRNVDLGPDRLDIFDLFYNIQGFLISAANISKVLWPTKAQNQARGEKLRRLLAVQEDSPLRSRAMRNHFEHFDERIEDWATSGRPFADMNVGDRRVMGSIVNPDEYLRHFDHVTGSVTFGTDTYLLPEIAKAVRDIGRRAHEEIAKLSQTD